MGWLVSKISYVAQFGWPSIAFVTIVSLSILINAVKSLFEIIGSLKSKAAAQGGARLQLNFNDDLSHATALMSDGIQCYDYRTFHVTMPDGKISYGWTTLVVIFMPKIPINYSKRTFVGGGGRVSEFKLEPEYGHFKIEGPLHGRTVDLQFSSKPIPN